MSDKSRWLVEMLDNDGNTHGEVFDDVTKLGDFVRVNASDAAILRILATTDDAIVDALWGRLDEEQDAARDV